MGAFFLLAVFALLDLVSLSMGLAWTPVRHETRVIFDVATEASVWTWANVVLLASAAYAHVLAAYFRWYCRRPAAAYWLMTAALLLALSLDDAVALHERLEGIGRSLGGGGGFLHFAWIVPGAAIAVLVMALFFLMMRNVSGRAKFLLLFGLLGFFFGAIGLEAVSGYAYTIGGYSTSYVLLYHLEEAFEAVGAVLMLCAGLSDLPASNRRLSNFLRQDA